MKYNYDIDLAVGKILGRERSCLGKKKYETREQAEDAMSRHNKSFRMHHKVGFYVCAFCATHHLGNTWHKDDIRILFKYHLSADEQECLIPLLDEI